MKDIAISQVTMHVGRVAHRDVATVPRKHIPRVLSAVTCILQSLVLFKYRLVRPASSR